MTPHPDEQALELRERLDQFIDREGEWDTKDAADKEIMAAFARVRQQTLEEAAQECESWGDQCAGGSGREIVPSGPSKGQPYGAAYYNLAAAIRLRQAAGEDSTSARREQR